MDLEKLCFDVQGLAKIAGLFISEEREKFNLEDVVVKGKADFVSYVDKQAEVQIVNGLRQLLPGSGFIAEEGTAKSSDEKYKWIIDPIDGTINFANGIPICCVSIGVEYQGKIIMGAVYNPNMNEFFFAESFFNIINQTVQTIAGFDFRFFLFVFARV